MKKELEYAVNFVGTIIQKHHGISGEQVVVFKEALSQNLREKIGKCWYPNNPIQGNAKRAITNLQNSAQVDVCLQKAAISAGILDIRSLLPVDFILWIDPHTVSYCCGEYGNTFTIYDGSKEVIFTDNKV